MGHGHICSTRKHWCLLKERRITWTCWQDVSRSEGPTWQNKSLPGIWVEAELLFIPWFSFPVCYFLILRSEGKLPTWNHRCYPNYPDLEWFQTALVPTTTNIKKGIKPNTSWDQLTQHCYKAWQQAVPLPFQPGRTLSQRAQFQRWQNRTQIEPSNSSPRPSQSTTQSTLFWHITKGTTGLWTHLNADLALATPLGYHRDFCKSPKRTRPWLSFYQANAQRSWPRGTYLLEQSVFISCFLNSSPFSSPKKAKVF